MDSHVSSILAMLEDCVLPLSYLEIITHELNLLVEDNGASYQKGWEEGYAEGQAQSEYEHDMEEE